MKKSNNEVIYSFNHRGDNNIIYMEGPKNQMNRLINGLYNFGVLTERDGDEAHRITKESETSLSVIFQTARDNMKKFFAAAKYVGILCNYLKHNDLTILTNEAGEDYYFDNFNEPLTASICNAHADKKLDNMRFDGSLSLA